MQYQSCHPAAVISPFTVGTHLLFSAALALKKVDIDDIDGAGDSALDFDQIPLTASSADITQREPQMQLVIATNEPALIGEWFHIRVSLINKEDCDVTDVTLVASLEEANDPIIADTTRLTLDYK